MKSILSIIALVFMIANFNGDNVASAKGGGGGGVKVKKPKKVKATPAPTPNTDFRTEQVSLFLIYLSG